MRLYPGALSAKFKMPEKNIKAHRVKPSQKNDSDDEKTRFCVSG